MSLQGTVASWIETRIEAQITALNTVTAIGTSEEFLLVGKHAPSVGILIVGGDSIDDESGMIFDGTQLITLDVGIWVSARGFRSGKDLSKTNGIYDLFDAIQAALKAQTPTGASEPLRYVSHDLEAIDSGLAIMVMQYQTAAQI